MVSSDKSRDNFINRITLVLLIAGLALLPFRADGALALRGGTAVCLMQTTAEGRSAQLLSGGTAGTPVQVFRDRGTLHARLLSERLRIGSDVRSTIRSATGRGPHWSGRRLLGIPVSPRRMSEAVFARSLRRIIRYEQEQDGRKSRTRKPMQTGEKTV